MYSKNFDEIKKISLEKESLDFFVENNKLILVNNASFRIFDENLTEIYSNDDVQNPGYVKFSKSNNNFVYSDYLKSENVIKSRFHILNVKDKSSICDFTFFNEFIIDLGFINDSDDKLYVVPTEKFYVEKTFKKANMIKDFKAFIKLLNRLGIHNFDNIKDNLGLADYLKLFGFQVCSTIL